MEYKIQVNDFEQEGNYLKGLVNITFGDSFKIAGIKIGEGKESSFFIGMPSYKAKEKENGKDVYKEICYPITKEFRDELYGNIFETFDSLHDGRGNNLVFNADSKEKLNPVVRVTPIDSGNLRGLASINFNDSFLVNNIQIKESREGKLFVAYPSYKTNKRREDGSDIYNNICYPVTRECREKLNMAILESYELEMKKSKEEMKKEQKVAPVKKNSRKKAI